MRRFILAAIAATAFAGTASGQDPWRSSYFPYLIGNPGDGVMLIGRWQRTQNAPYFISRSDDEDIVNPITFAGAVSIEAGVGTAGSWLGRAEFRGPGLIDGWRFRALIGAERTAKLGFYGLGGDIERSRNEDGANADVYRTRRVRYLAQAEVTRRIAGGLRFALGAFLDRTELTARDDSTIFRDQFGESVKRANLVLRPALIFDSRDREFTPSRGFLIEAALGIGTARENSPAEDQSLYATGHIHVRGYAPLRDGTVLALRGFYRGMEDAAPLSARFGVAGWERDFSLSGADGFRGLPLGALAGTSFGLLSAEIRHDLLAAGDLGAITIVGFADWARVEDNAATLRHDSDQFGAGAGLAVRILRSAILSMNFAGGQNGFNFSMGTSWNF